MSYVARSYEAIQAQRPIGFSPAELSQRVNEEVIFEHLQEATFGWLQRESAISAPHYRLKDLARLDDNLEAHLEGLELAGETGWSLCQAELTREEPGEVFVASALAFSSGVPQQVEMVLAACVTPELERALVAALGWTRAPEIRHYIDRLLQSDQTQLRRIGLAACSIKRIDPGRTLAELLHDSDQRMRARACKAVGELGRTDLWMLLRELLVDNNEATRFYAAWALARLQKPSAGMWAVLRELALGGGKFAERALDISIRCLPRRERVTWYQELKKQDCHLRLAALAAGAVGDPALVDDLIDLTKSAIVARRAGEAFSLIVGVDLAYLDLEGKQPEGFTSGPSENSEDDVVALDPDENLPWPAFDRLATWWELNRHRFHPGSRYFLGTLLNQESLLEGLNNGTQTVRSVAALELVLAVPTRPLFEIRARAKEQLRLLTL